MLHNNNELSPKDIKEIIIIYDINNKIRYLDMNLTKEIMTFLIKIITH